MLNDNQTLELSLEKNNNKGRYNQDIWIKKAGHWVRVQLASFLLKVMVTVDCTTELFLQDSSVVTRVRKLINLMFRSLSPNSKIL